MKHNFYVSERRTRKEKRMFLVLISMRNTQQGSKHIFSPQTVENERIRENQENICAIVQQSNVSFEGKSTSPDVHEDQQGLNIRQKHVSSSPLLTTPNQLNP
jgi:hypothetical protein